MIQAPGAEPQKEQPQTMPPGQPPPAGQPPPGDPLPPALPPAGFEVPADVPGEDAILQVEEPAPALKPQFGDILIPSLWLIGAIFLLGLAWSLYKRFRDAEPEQKPAASVHEQLTMFRTLYERGELSEAEYKKVHALLAGRIQSEPRLAPPAASAPPAQGAEGAAGGPQKDNGKSKESPDKN